jgi:hypothetical protein
MTADDPLGVPRLRLFEAGPSDGSDPAKRWELRQNGVSVLGSETASVGQGMGAPGANLVQIAALVIPSTHGNIPRR